MRAESIMIRSGPAIAMLFFIAVPGAEAAQQRFTLTGNATLSRDAQSLSDGKMSLRGYLQSNDAPSSSAVVQDGGRFTVMARAVAVAQVCYNDTIFRDDFDGDGG